MSHAKRFVTTTRTRRAYGGGVQVGGAHPERMYQELRPRIKVRAVTAQVCAGGDARLGVVVVGGLGSRARLAFECIVVL